SPFPPPAPTAAPWPATTTTSPGRECSPSMPIELSGSSCPRITRRCSPPIRGWPMAGRAADERQRQQRKRRGYAGIEGCHARMRSRRHGSRRTDSEPRRRPGRTHRGATELNAIVVRDASRPRSGIDPDLLTTDAEAAIADADIVVELMGGIEPARSLITAALQQGSSVVTANKALLAASYGELMSAADAAGVRLEHEAAVAGAIPIIRPVGDSLAGDRIER